MPRFLAVTLLILLAVLAYAPALANDFAFDDALARSTTNDGKTDFVISKLHEPWFYFSSQYWLGEDKESRLYRPVTIYSYALTYNLISGPLLPKEWEAFPHHLLNLLLNAWAAYLVLWMMRDLGVGFAPALLTAALFGVHALHSEVVATIVGRADLFAFCFGMAGFWAWRRVWPLSAVLFFLALCSKENAVAWLALLPCYVLVRTWQGDAGATVFSALRPRALRLLLVCGVPLLLFLLLRANAIAGWRHDVFYTANPLYHEPADIRLLTAIKVWGYGLYKCVAPFSLACLYSLQAITLVKSFWNPGFLCAAVILLGSLVVGLWRPNRKPLLFLSVAIFFGFSCVTANVFLAIGTIFGERLYFIPSLGVCMLPALALSQLGSAARRVLVAACTLWMVVSIGVDLRRSMVWKDNQSLMLHDAVVQPDCASLQVKAARMHDWLSEQEQESHRKQEHRDKAWAFLRRAQQLDPDYVNAIVLEATFLGKEGRHDEALAILRRALKAKRLKTSGLEPRIRGEIGMLLIEKKGQQIAGVRELQEAVRLRPRLVQHRIALIEHGKGVLTVGEMERLFVEAAELNSRNLLLWALRADFIFDHGVQDQRNAEQIVDLLQAVFRSLSEEATHERAMVRARLQLAVCLEALGRRDEARRSYEILLSLKEATAEQKREAARRLRDLLGR